MASTSAEPSGWGGGVGRLPSALASFGGRHRRVGGGHHRVGSGISVVVCKVVSSVVVAVMVVAVMVALSAVWWGLICKNMDPLIIGTVVGW